VGLSFVICQVTNGVIHQKRFHRPRRRQANNRRARIELQSFIHTDLYLSDLIRCSHYEIFIAPGDIVRRGASFFRVAESTFQSIVAEPTVLGAKRRGSYLLARCPFFSLFLPYNGAWLGPFIRYRGIMTLSTNNRFSQ
jgi:hypothetical protein